jgi:hypothetical protein
MKCPKCKAEVFKDVDGEIKEKGIHNWKNLFRKPSKQDWFILLILLLTFIMIYLYFRDINALKEYYINNCVCSFS